MGIQSWQQWQFCQSCVFVKNPTRTSQCTNQRQESLSVEGQSPT